MKKNISIFSFFSGCGLLDLGFERAGYNIVFVNEKFMPFMDAYKYSRKNMDMNSPIYGYHTETIEEYLESSSYLSNVVRDEKERNIVGFIGGPPCPDFSTAGKNKGADGENGKLTKVYFDIIIKENPDFFVFENVKGLWKTKKHREFYDKIKLEIQKKGYITIDRVVNALEYEVPQERERIIMIGIKVKDYSKIDLIDKILKGFKWGINEEKILEKIKEMQWPKQELFEEKSVREIPDGIDEKYTVEYWFKRNDVYTHFNSEDYFKPRQGLDKMKIIYEGDVSRKSYKRLHRWRYSPTAAYGNNEVHLHPYLCRRLSVAEVLAIQSAPKEFMLPKDMTLTNKFKTIGNGVPFLMAFKLADELKELLEKIEVIWGGENDSR